MPSGVLPVVIEQHVDELTTLWATRTGLRAAGFIGLRQLARFDDRIAAHEDGCVLGGSDAVDVLTSRLDLISSGRVFAAAVVALDLHDGRTISRCLALAEANPDARRGMTSALGWVSSSQLKGVVKELLKSPSGIQRSIGLAACRLHGVDPGSGLPAALKDPNSDVRTEGVRAAGVLGLPQASSLSSRTNQEAPCHFWSAWADVLLGDRGQALGMLRSAGVRDGVHRRRAFHLACQAITTAAGHDMLSRLADEPLQLRWLIEGCGVVGDPVYAPWLIKHMSEPSTARLAGQAFSLICGVDLAANRLDQPAPENLDTGPNDNPDDPDVDMDEDDGLPWPDAKKIEAWWATNGHRFQKGVRYFMGAPVTREHCIEVLKNGYQRQRILAAHYLCLLEPGTPLFNTSAPAWRQQRWLAKM